MKCGFPLILAVFLAGAAGAHDYELGKLTIGHPWTTVTHGGLRTAAVYVTFVNDGPKADKLLKVSSPAAQMAMIHANIKTGDVMSMREQDGIDIPAGKTVELKPGGMHIMLMGVDHPLKNGEMLPLTLTLANEGEVKVEVMVSDN
jgi:copper(I)-binding protein